MQEKIISTESIYEGRVVHLVVHDVLLPGGGHSKREIIRHPGAVALVAFDADNNVLLVRQFRMAANRVMLEIPAGTLEKGEAPEACAIRELQEETGYKPGQIESLGGIYTAPGYTTEFIHLFMATDLTASVLAADDDENIEVVRVPLLEAIALIERGEIADGKSSAGLLRAARRLGV